MTETFALNDAADTGSAWTRFKKSLWLIAAISVFVALGVAGLLWWLRGPLPWVFLGMIIGGVWATIMMAAFLMGLIFVSSSSGHDHSVDDLDDAGGDDAPKETTN